MLSSPRTAYEVVVSSAMALDTTPSWSIVSTTPKRSKRDSDETARRVDMDPELEPFIPLFPAADLSDPVTAREKLAELTRAAPAPDAGDVEVEDHTVSADPH